MSRRRHRKVRADIDGRTYRPGSLVLQLPHTALQERDVLIASAHAQAYGGAPADAHLRPSRVVAGQSVTVVDLGDSRWVLVEKEPWMMDPRPSQPTQPDPEARKQP